MTAKLVGAEAYMADLIGASLGSADLRGASLDSAHLQGANLSQASLEGADLTAAALQGALLPNARMQGASLLAARLSDAVLFNVQVWRASGEMVDVLDTDQENLDCRTPPWANSSSNTKRGKVVESSIYKEWVAGITEQLPDDRVRRSVVARLKRVDPSLVEPNDSTWNRNCAINGRSEGMSISDPDTDVTGDFVMDMACAPEAVPYVLRQLVRSRVFQSSSRMKWDSPERIHTRADRLSMAMHDSKSCPAIGILNAQDREDIQEFVEGAAKYVPRYESRKEIMGTALTTSRAAPEPDSKMGRRKSLGRKTD